jgi:hypothetical protein
MYSKQHVRLYKTVKFLQLLDNLNRLAIKYRFTYHSRFSPEGVVETSISPRRPHCTKMTTYTSTSEVRSGKPITVRSQSISGESAVNSIPFFHGCLIDIYGRKGEVLFFCSVPNTTRDS